MKTKTSRRLFLAASSATAVFGALSAAAVAQEADPIYAAIERHKAAWSAFSEACDRTDEVAVHERGGVVTAEDEAFFEAANDAEVVALDALLATAPATIAGVRAVIAYIADFDHACLTENPAKLLETLLRSPMLAP